MLFVTSMMPFTCGLKWIARSPSTGNQLKMLGHQQLGVDCPWTYLYNPLILFYEYNFITRIKIHIGNLQMRCHFFIIIAEAVQTICGNNTRSFSFRVVLNDKHVCFENMWYQVWWHQLFGWFHVLLPDTQNCSLRMRRECRERIPRHLLQRKPLVSGPGMHRGTRIMMHVGIAKTFPGILRACATRNFTHLARGPCNSVYDPFHDDPGWFIGIKRFPHDLTILILKLW